MASGLEFPKTQQRQIEERSNYPAKVSAVSQKRYNMNKCN
jgi:hypothetical protein